MSVYDNEIYRGPPETGPTLKQDNFSYGKDFYIVKPEQTTAQQDEPATEENLEVQSNPPKKKSRIAKAVKLLTSCVTTVVVAATLVGTLQPGTSAGVSSRWSRFGRAHGDGNFSFTVPSQNGGVCQTSIGGKTYRLTTQQEGLYLQWHETYDMTQDGSRGGFYVCMENVPEQWQIILDFNVNPLYQADYDEGLGQIWTDSGEVLYVRNFYIGKNKSVRSAQEIIDDLDSYIQISDTTNDGWGCVYVGDTMYSQINESWNGFQAIGPWHAGADFRFIRICSIEDAAYSAENLVCRHRVNGIDWSFYFTKEEQRTLLWAVPEQENIAFGHVADKILAGYGIETDVLDQVPAGVLLSDVHGELGAKLRSELLNMIEAYTIGCALQYYYLVDAPTKNVLPETLAQWPQIATWNTSLFSQGYSGQAISMNSNICQVSVGGTVYQIESLVEGVHIFSLRTRDYKIHVDTPDYSWTSAVVEEGYYQVRDFDLSLQEPVSGRQVGMRISEYPLGGIGESTNSAYGTIQTESGKILYVMGIQISEGEMMAENGYWLPMFLSNPSAYLRITELDQMDRRRVQIGDSLISDVDTDWNGFRTTKFGQINPNGENNFNWMISEVRYTDSIDITSYSHVEDRQINGIQWSFYFQYVEETANFPDAQIHLLTGSICAIPSYGDFCLELGVHDLMTSISGYEDYVQVIEDPMFHDEWIYQILDIVEEDGLQHIYPIT